MTISPLQALLARVGLGYSMDQIAEKFGYAKNQISSYEKRGVNLSEERVKELERFYRSQGAVFIGETGVDFRKEFMYTLSGVEGFRSLMDDVYATARDLGGRIEILNGSPSLFTKHLGAEWYAMHAARMYPLRDSIQFRIVATKGDKPIASSFAEYKWMDANGFYNQTVYIYGSSVAFITFEEEAVFIEIIKRETMVHTFHYIFDFIWSQFEEEQ
jgi:transcriptional regulator with XRE-family HTH domain